MCVCVCVCSPESVVSGTAMKTHSVLRSRTGKRPASRNQNIESELSATKVDANDNPLK